MRVFLFSLLMLTLAGCASNVVTVYDSETDFANYASWAFAPEEEGKSFTSLDSGQIENAVERELKHKALTKARPEEADLLVTWRIVDEEWLEPTGFGVRYEYGRGGWASEPALREVREVRLIVEFVDNDTDRVVWRVASRRQLTENQSSESPRKLIDGLVADIFKKFPPGV